ncbi:MAG: ABC transporter permease [Alphaproteobacteria bacterium]|nr:ABC transporter permease [Alphaproteobacteria bacterium]
MRLERRAAASGWMGVLAPVFAVLAAALGAALLFAVMGKDPLSCLHSLFIAPLADAAGVSELALKATPLLLCAIGIAVGVQANVWNIGAEGQFTMGAITGGAVALWLGPDGGWFVLPLVLLAGVLGGMAWAGIAALLRTRFNAHEILVTLMLSYVAIQILGWLVRGPMQDPDGFNFPQSRQFEPAATLPLLFEGGRVTIAALFALAAVPAGALLLGRTLIGYRIRVVGLAPGAARYAGFSETAAVWFCLLLSGGLAGLAGVAEVAGPVGQLLPTISPGYGFAAIIVAFLGRLRPVGILLAAVLMALLYLGGEGLQITQQVPLAATGVIQGMLLLFLLGADVLVLYRIRFGARAHG